MFAGRMGAAVNEPNAPVSCPEMGSFQPRNFPRITSGRRRRVACRSLLAEASFISLRDEAHGYWLAGQKFEGILTVTIRPTEATIFQKFAAPPSNAQ